jgi:hypothetical protein
MNTQDEQQGPAQSAAYNPFPEPQTIPSGWDLSEPTSTSHNDREMVEEPAAKN